MLRTPLSLAIRRVNGSAESIPLPDLHDVLDRLTEGLFGIAFDSGSQPGEVTLTIERLDPQVVELSATKPAVISCQLLGQAIRERDYSLVPGKGRSAIVGLSLVARRNGWNIEVRQGTDTLVAVSADYQPPSRETYMGPGTLAGNIRRIDDQRQEILLRLPTGRTRTYPVASAEILEAIRPFFYRDVVLAGEGHWFVETGKLAEFEVTGINISTSGRN